tara:strand:+ start:80 stop:919 length:840 start_codon:yes stop_codon:yes gene_type:complete
MANVLRYRGLYSHQKRKKQPSYTDCLVVIVRPTASAPGLHRLTLHSEDGAREIYATHLTEAEVERLVGESSAGDPFADTETETEKYLVQIEDRITTSGGGGDGGSNTNVAEATKMAPPPPAAKRRGRLMLRAPVAKKPKRTAAAAAAPIVDSLDWCAIEAEASRYLASLPNADEVTLRSVRAAVAQALRLDISVLKVPPRKQRFKSLVTDCVNAMDAPAAGPGGEESAGAAIAAIVSLLGPSPLEQLPPPPGPAPLGRVKLRSVPRTREELRAVLYPAR